MNRCFIEKETETAFKHVKRCSASFIIKVMLINTTSNFSPFRLIQIQRLVNTLLGEAMETGTLVHYLQEFKIVQPWKRAAFIKIINALLTDPVIPLLERYPTDTLHIYEMTCTQVYSPQAVTGRDWKTLKYPSFIGILHHLLGLLNKLRHRPHNGIFCIC